MAGTFQLQSSHPMRILICLILLGAVPSAPGYSLFDDRNPESDPDLVSVDFISVIQGLRDAVEINGRLVTNYSPTIEEKFSSTGIVIDQDHVMAFLGNDRWIDIKSHNPRIEITTSEGQKWKGALIGVDQRNGVAVIRLLNGKLKKTPICPQCDVKDGTTIMAPVMEGVNLSRYRKAQVLSIGTWPGIPKQSGWMIAMTHALPDVNLPIFTPDHRVLGLIASQDPRRKQTLVYPISGLLSSARQIIKSKGDIRAGWLGVFGEDLPASADSGILVRDMEPDSPAEKAGLLPGDRLVKYRGQQIQDFRQYVYLVEGTPIGSKAKLEIIRKGNPMTLEALIEARKPQQNQIRLSFTFPGAFGPPVPETLSEQQSSQTLIGLQTELLTPPLADAMHIPGQTGLLVLDVVKQKPADLAGVRAGDVITSINGRPIDDPFRFASYLMTRNWSVPLVLRILRKGTEITIPIQVPDGDR
jgi:serine protease Do